MIVRAKHRPTTATPSFTLTSILSRLFDLDARYRQRVKFDRLTEAERRDMGLPLHAQGSEKAIRDRLFLSQGW